MRFKAFFTFVLSLLLSAAYADTIEITGQVTVLAGPMPAAIYASPYHVHGEEATATISGNNFVIRVALTQPAMYTLRFQYIPYDIMLSPADRQVRVAATLSNGQLRNIKVENARENEAYRAMSMQTKAYDEKIKKFFISCDKEETCGQELHAILADYKADLDDIGAKYKGTYTTDVLIPMKSPAISPDISKTAAEFRAGYFGRVAFGDIVLLSTPLYKEMIDAYVDFMIDPTYRGQEAFIKNLMASAKANPEVLSKTAGYLCDALIWKSREKMLAIFIRWYGENKDALNNKWLDTKITAISKVMPGTTYIDIAGADPAGVQQSLKDMMEKSVCTLVMFWSPGCSHCTEEIPYIKEVYAKYHGKGLSVYGYCVDEEAERWRTYVRDQQLGWTNVINGSGDHKAMEAYAIETTPTLVMIDKKGTIIHRFVPRSKMDKYIEEILNK